MSARGLWFTLRAIVWTTSLFAIGVAGCLLFLPGVSVDERPLIAPGEADTSTVDSEPLIIEGGSGFSEEWEAADPFEQKLEPRRRKFRPLLKYTIVEKVSTYTATCDGGSPRRPTAAANFRAGGQRPDPKYPRAYTTMKHILDREVSIVAVPWDWRFIHEELTDYPDGSRFHKYVVRFPWYDPPGHYRLPVDRVPYRDKAGNVLPQHDRFDMFMFMPRSQAKRHGVVRMPIEVYRMEWVEE